MALQSIESSRHTSGMLRILSEWKSTKEASTLLIDGTSLTMSSLVAVGDGGLRVTVSEVAVQTMRENNSFLKESIESGGVVYGVNTGFGGSADVRSSDVEQIQRALIVHTNAGFGASIDVDIIRAVMAARVNSLSLAYSGARPEVAQLLCDMINNDVIPVVPKRGSVSASGDLMPLSYIAACMMGRKDAKVICKGVQMTAWEAFDKSGLKFITFQAKEALSVINAASVANTLGARVLLDSSLAMFLTQVVTALSVEALQGRMESFHETVHKCLPHDGNKEVAGNVRSLLEQSTMVQRDFEWQKLDDPNSLKQDRYALRTSAQWLGPTVETWSESARRITTELNSANDNPLIDHREKHILHCGNFQGISCTVAMDQARQSLQICGRLIFAQISELLNHTTGHGLPPNLSGRDVNIDFGFKGVDVTTAGYMSELDYLTQPLTNHVHSAEMHNQSVNSLALVSARMSADALELLQMMLSNALCALCQAVELRWLRGQVLKVCGQLLAKHKLVVNGPIVHIQARGGSIYIERKGKSVCIEDVSWYDLVFTPRRASAAVAARLADENNHAEFHEEFLTSMDNLMNELRSDKHIPLIATDLGRGTRLVYLYIRSTLGVPFHDGSFALDTGLEKIFEAIKRRNFVDVIIEIFSTKTISSK